MFSSKFRTSRDGHAVPRCISIATDKPGRSQTPKLASQSFHESLLRKRGAASGDSRDQSKKSSEAGSSSDHAKQTSKPDNEKYNKVNIRDLLFDRGQTDDSEGNICTINNCNRKFISKEPLEIHQRRAHSPPTAHVCPVCFASFSTVPNLNKHVRYSLFFIVYER